MLLQHDLRGWALGVPDGCEVFLGLEGRVPDVEADCECEERGDDDARDVQFEVGSVAVQEEGGDAEEKGGEHDDGVDFAH